MSEKPTLVLIGDIVNSEHLAHNLPEAAYQAFTEQFNTEMSRQVQASAREYFEIAGEEVRAYYNIEDAPHEAISALACALGMRVALRRILQEVIEEARKGLRVPAHRTGPSSIASGVRDPLKSAADELGKLLSRPDFGEMGVGLFVGPMRYEDGRPLTKLLNTTISTAKRHEEASRDPKCASSKVVLSQSACSAVVTAARGISNVRETPGVWTFDLRDGDSDPRARLLSGLALRQIGEVKVKHGSIEGCWLVEISNEKLVRETLNSWTSNVPADRRTKPERRLFGSGTEFSEIPDNYEVSSPVSGQGVRFFGRTEEVQRLIRAIRAGDHVAIIGAQRMGKSSLVQEVFEEHAGSRPDFTNTLLAPINFQEIGGLVTYDDFYNKILGEICMAIQQRSGDDAATLAEVRKRVDAVLAAPRDTNLQFKAFLHYLLPTLQKKGFARLVLFLDEFSELFETLASPKDKKSRAIDLELMRFLSSLMKDSAIRKNLTFVLALRPFAPLVHDELDLQILKCAGVPIYLDYLDHAAGASLIRRPVENHLHYPDAVVDAILDTTAGHPWLTQLLCKELVHRLNDLKTRSHVTIEDVDAVVEEMSGQERSLKYESPFSILDSDFTLRQREEDWQTGKQVIATIAHLSKETGLRGVSFHAILEDMRRHRSIDEAIFSDVVRQMVACKILRETGSCQQGSPVRSPDGDPPAAVSQEQSLQPPFPQNCFNEIASEVTPWHT